MGKLFLEYKKLFRDKKYKKSLIFGIIILIASAIISSLAIGYADGASGNYVGDLILDNIPTIHLFWFRSFGIAFIIIFVVALGISKPRYLPFMTKTIGLMYIIRALFIAMTHLKFYPEKIAVPDNYFIFAKLPYQGNDLFFSGHVAFPFLIALIFWDNKKLRYTFFAISAISGLAALFAKTHYSIDVFAAPFITYSIYKISEKIFKKDFEFWQER